LTVATKFNKQIKALESEIAQSESDKRATLDKL